MFAGPDFFIVGAPKCGTTALHTYLGERDDVFVCTPKEPNYFATDFPTQRYVDTAEAYGSLFRPAPESARVRGEASAWYLYSTAAIPNIRGYNPDARIIAMVRNPLDMLPSLHRMLMLNFAEDIEDLETAWDLQESRRSGVCLPRKRNRRFDVSTLQYADVCRLGHQIDRLQQHFPADQTCIITFDEFTGDTRAVYARVLEFLGLPPDDRSHFPAVNVRRDFRSRKLARMAWRFRELGTTVKQRLGIKRSFGVQQALNRFNERREPKPQLSENFRRRLSEEFREDIGLLSRLTGQDLSHWLQAGPDSLHAGIGHSINEPGQR